MKTLKSLVAGIVAGLTLKALLIGALVLAAILKTFAWDNATTYINGNPILPGDIYTEIFCGIESGGPYPVQVGTSIIDATSVEADAQALVDQYGVGEYFCVARHTSALYATSSGDSNEINFSVTPLDVGYVPNPPTNFRLNP